MRCGVIIVGAGRGTRLRAPQPKALLTLGVKPLFQHSLETFQSHSRLKEMVLVLPADIPVPRLENVTPPPVRGQKARFAGWTGGGVKVVSGGARRQDSVARGLEAVSPECQTVLIHDAARPFVSLALIERILAALEAGRNAIPLVPVADTIKQVEGGQITATIDRQSLRGAQTPQGFQTSILREALAEAERQNWTVTDEAALLEKLNIPVYGVTGDPWNMKITTEDDWKLAELLYENRARL